MSVRQIELSTLVGKKVRDADGRAIGRVKELTAEISLDEGSEYVVREFQVGRYAVPWKLMDLRDPGKPRVLVRGSELGRNGNDSRKL